MATEADILADTSAARQVFRFASQPDIVVIQFPTLAEQASTLNRAAAYTEKAGFPRDRVLGNAELDLAIRRSGETAETFYVGHDYRSADLFRFFDAAARSEVALTPQETWLQAALPEWGWQPGTRNALITLVRATPSAGIDGEARAAILRHELSHGLFFTSPDYEVYATRFWSNALTAPERAAIRRFLAAEGYDVALHDLVVNEAQAYLIHTADKRLFAPARVGMKVERLSALQSAFIAGMPPGWLRDRSASVKR